MPTKKKHKKKIVMRPVIANQLTKNKDKFSTRSGISVPQNTSPKYPVFLEALCKRIKRLQLLYGLQTNLLVYNIITDASKIKFDLKDKGGVYILWCKKTGLFYVGSTLRYFTKNGRLHSYFRKVTVEGTLQGKNTRVSKELASQIQEHGIENFYLLIPQFGFSSLITPEETFSWEQIFIILYPTLNRTLSVIYNIITEEVRVKISTVFFQYEIKKNILIKKTEQVLFGLKETVREGVKNVAGLVFSIDYDTLKGHFINNMV